MIITCPNCKKKFKINPSLVPEEGRDLQCGSCANIWFYKVEDQSSVPLTLNESFANKDVETNLINEDVKEQDEDKKNLADATLKKKEKIPKKNLENKKHEINKENTAIKFLSYLIVFIISFVSLIIFIDTFKTPLINAFPSVEIILFNLFETLKDIKLFIIDLS